MLVGDDLPQLRWLLWVRKTCEVSEEEALALYESNRQWVDPSTMTERERCFFEGLVARYGGGVYLG